MRGKQVRVAIGMVAAMLVILLAWRFVPEIAPVADSELLFRLRLLTGYLMVPALCLAVGIGFVANRRFFSADAIDGQAPIPGSSLDIALRYNRNTLEQVALVVVAWPALTLRVLPPQLDLLPVLAGLFAAGRVLFWLGYLYAPWARAFGFALTFYPTAALLVWMAVTMAAGQ